MYRLTNPEQFIFSIIYDMWDIATAIFGLTNWLGCCMTVNVCVSVCFLTNSRHQCFTGNDKNYRETSIRCTLNACVTVGCLLDNHWQKEPFHRLRERGNVCKVLIHVSCGSIPSLSLAACSGYGEGSVWGCSSCLFLKMLLHITVKINPTKHVVVVTVRSADRQPGRMV